MLKLASRSPSYGRRSSAPGDAICRVFREGQRIRARQVSELPVWLPRARHEGPSGPRIVVHAGACPKATWCGGRRAAGRCPGWTGAVPQRLPGAAIRHGRLTGRAVLAETVSRGKHLLTRVEGDITVHTHLKMEGSWRVSRAAGYPAARSPGPAVLANDTGRRSAISSASSRYSARAASTQAVGHLGPDLLGPDFDAEEAVRRLSAIRTAPSARR